MELGTVSEIDLCRGAGLVKLKTRNKRAVSNDDPTPNCINLHFNSAARKRVHVKCYLHKRHFARPSPAPIALHNGA